MLKCWSVGIILFALVACSGQKQLSVSGAQTGLNHIALNVRNLETSSRFYREVLLLDTMANPFNDGLHTWFLLPGGSQLHLIQHQDIPAQVKGTQICLSIKHMPQSIKSLDALNMNWEDWPGKSKTVTRRPDGVQQIYFRDPDGYWIEVNDDHPANKPR